ncbi:hypothetical protein F5Y12DRAFT_709916 [Xylaria sp. FL1777]|nr:hypothetical protein F5Y12DRAFT_709916 [Xylaria sp. FL1777]
MPRCDPAARTSVESAGPLQSFPMHKAQTLEQRRRNAKFVKEQDARRGKAETEIKKRNKDAVKSPISPFWLGILGFVVFGGLLFELISRIFF